MIYTTLNKIIKCDPCEDRLQVLLKALPHHNKSKKIPLDFILKSNGIDDTMWIFQNECDIGNNEMFIRSFAVWCAWRVLPNYEKQFPTDKTVRECLQIVKKYTKGRVTNQELDAAARSAWSAARSAAWSAWSAARSAARSAAWSAEKAESAESAESAEKEKQAKKLFQMLRSHK